MIRVSSLSFHLVLALLALAAFMVLGNSEALAQSKQISDVSRNVGNNLVVIPRFVVLLAYVGGTFFAITGLLKLKDWIIDGSKTPLMSVIIRLSVAALMIYFPYLLIVINTTLFGSAGNGGTQDVNVKVRQQTMEAFEAVK